MTHLQFLEYEGQLCYIPTGNTCFRMCLEEIYKSVFSNEYKKVILSSDRCKSIMTSAKIQPFFLKNRLDIGVYNLNSERMFLRTLTQKIICLFLYKTHFCILWKLNRRNSLLDVVAEIKNNFRYEETQIIDNTLKQLIEFMFPISHEMNCLYNFFAFDLEACNVE